MKDRMHHQRFLPPTYIWENSSCVLNDQIVDFAFCQPPASAHQARMIAKVNEVF